MKSLAWVVLFACTALGCAANSLKSAGEECFGTSECAPGLVCNYGYTPAMCTDPSDRPPDAAVPTPDAAPVVDGDIPDGPVTPPPDGPPPPDALPPDAPPPDAPPPDAPPPDAPVADAA
jgi:hypothetical protein